MPAQQLVEELMNCAAASDPHQHVDADDCAGRGYLLSQAPGTGYLDRRHEEHVELDLSIYEPLDEHNPPSLKLIVQCAHKEEA